MSGKSTIAAEAPGRARPGGRTQDVANRIFRTTIDQLTAHGYGALNFQDIAEKADVARSTLYRRWPTKAELVLDAMSYTLAERLQFRDEGSLAVEATTALRALGVMLTSPFGSAVMAARHEMQQRPDEDDWRGELWIRRFTEILPLFERAKKRGELPADFDSEAALAAAAGALHYRVLIMARPVDDEWIRRVIAIVAPSAAAAGKSRVSTADKPPRAKARKTPARR